MITFSRLPGATSGSITDASATQEGLATQTNTMDRQVQCWQLFEARPIGPVTVYKSDGEGGWTELEEGTFFLKPNRVVIFPEANLPDPIGLPGPIGLPETIGDQPNLKMVFPVHLLPSEFPPESAPEIVLETPIQIVENTALAVENTAPETA